MSLVILKGRWLADTQVGIRAFHDGTMGHFVDLLNATESG